jgi:Spy/CpxP family protein refolding chaperone
MIRRNVVRGTVLAALLALGTWGALAVAQPPPDDELDTIDALEHELTAYRAGHAGMGPWMGMGMGAGRGGRHGMGHGAAALAALDLTEQQKDRIEAIHDKQRRSAIEIRKNLELARLDMRKLVRADTPDRRAIETQVDRMSGLRAQLQKSQLNAMLDVRGVLTPEQLKQLEQLRGEGVGRGRRGPPPGGGQ